MQACSMRFCAQPSLLTSLCSYVPTAVAPSWGKSWAARATRESSSSRRAGRRRREESRVTATSKGGQLRVSHHHPCVVCASGMPEMLIKLVPGGHQPFGGHLCDVIQMGANALDRLRKASPQVRQSVFEQRAVHYRSSVRCTHGACNSPWRVSLSLSNVVATRAKGARPMPRTSMWGGFPGDVSGRGCVQPNTCPEGRVQHYEKRSRRRSLATAANPSPVARAPPASAAAPRRLRRSAVSTAAPRTGETLFTPRDSPTSAFAQAAKGKRLL